MNRIKLALVSLAATLALTATPAFAQDFHRAAPEQDFHFRGGARVSMDIAAPDAPPSALLLPAVQKVREAAARMN